MGKDSEGWGETTRTVYVGADKASIRAVSEQYEDRLVELRTKLDTALEALELISNHRKTPMHFSVYEHLARTALTAIRGKK